MTTTITITTTTNLMGFDTIEINLFFKTVGLTKKFLKKATYNVRQVFFFHKIINREVKPVVLNTINLMN